MIESSHCHYCRGSQPTRTKKDQVRCIRCGRFLFRKKPALAPVAKAGSESS